MNEQYMNYHSHHLNMLKTEMPHSVSSWVYIILQYVFLKRNISFENFSWWVNIEDCYKFKKRFSTLRSVNKAHFSDITKVNLETRRL